MTLRLELRMPELAVALSPESMTFLKKQRKRLRERRDGHGTPMRAERNNFRLVLGPTKHVDL